jgi:hypothetical protein
MARLDELFQNVNTENLGEEGDFDALPTNDYVAIMENSSDEKPNSKGTGSVQSVLWQIIEGNFKGRKLYENFNVRNENIGSVTQALRSINGIRIATGKPDAKDFSELYNIPIIISVEYNESDKKFPNRIKKHSPLTSTSPKMATQQTTAKTPATTNTPPWVKK